MYLSQAFGVMYCMKPCPYCRAENQEGVIACWYCGRNLQASKTAQISVWKLTATSALVLTFLSTCAIAIHVDNEFEALRSLVFDVPVTFLLWWLICTFLVWVWRHAASALHGIWHGQLAQWLKNLLP